MKSSFLISAACAVALAACGTSSGDKKNVLSDPKEALKVADAAREGGDYAAAIKLYQRVIEEQGDGYETRMGLGGALAGAGQVDQAELEFKAAAKLSPGRADPYLATGRLDLSRHRPAEALTALDAALILSPDSVAVWNNKGIALDMLERHEEAQQCYRNGLAHAPHDHQLLNNYGLSLALSGNYAESVKQLTLLVQEPGATARNRQNLALALGLEGDTADAKAIARTDLDEASIANNLRFYEAARDAPMPKQSAVLPVMPLTPVAAPSGPQPDAAGPAPAAAPADAGGAAPNPTAVTQTSLPPPTPAAPDTAGSAGQPGGPAAPTNQGDAGAPVPLAPPKPQ